MIRSNNPLSNEEIQRFAPSAFAGQPYERMSDRYAFVPTSAVIDGMRSAGFLPMMASQSTSRIADKKNFTKHMIRFRSVNSQLTKVGDSDLETVLINSHDGTSRYVLMLGVFRLVCSNGLIISEGLVHSIKIKHVGNIIDEVINGSLNLIDEAPKIGNQIQQWRTITLKPAEQLMLAESAHMMRYPDQTSISAQAIKPKSLLKERRSEDNGSDLWSTFNRIQENTVRGGIKGHVFEGARIRRRSVREVKGIDQNVDLNKALWTLAELMAELKGAN
jgi:Domain of unknown function (DUF932)